MHKLPEITLHGSVKQTFATYEKVTSQGHRVCVGMTNALPLGWSNMHVCTSDRPGRSDTFEAHTISWYMIFWLRGKAVVLSSVICSDLIINVTLIYRSIWIMGTVSPQWQFDCTLSKMFSTHVFVCDETTAPSTCSKFLDEVKAVFITPDSGSFDTVNSISALNHLKMYQ